MRRLLSLTSATFAATMLMAGPASAAGAVPPPMSVVEVEICVNFFGDEVPASGGLCPISYTLVSTSTVINPAGNAPKGLNK